MIFCLNIYLNIYLDNHLNFYLSLCHVCAEMVIGAEGLDRISARVPLCVVEICQAAVKQFVDKSAQVSFAEFQLALRIIVYHIKP